MCDRTQFVPRPPLTLELANLCGVITTQPCGFAMYLPAADVPFGCVDWPAGGSDEYHRRVCLHLAHVFFGAGFGRRMRIRESLFASPPAEGYRRWEWTRDTRPMGHEFIWVTDFLVFQVARESWIPLAHPTTSAGV